MPGDKDNINPRELMELAVESMQESISENRSDKSSPLVGAVLVMPDGRVEKAHRGELSDGDHAEYTLLERKLASENLAGSVLFSTLEPCAPGARSINKTSCAERIVNRRIKKVWVGIEDPDPLVDKNGIQYLLDNGITVELFDRDLQEQIRQANKNFIDGAIERANCFQKEPVKETTSDLEKPIQTATIDDLDTNEIKKFIENTEYNFEYGSDEFYRMFIQLGFLAKDSDIVYPTGLGVLLFGKNPQIFYPHALVRATYTYSNGTEEIANISGSLPEQARESLKWFKRIIGKQNDRTSAERIEVLDYPEDAFRECICNALAHRSYDIMGASIQVEINDNAIIIKSPGGPVKPISLDSIKNLSAPILSKNPKIIYVFEVLNLSESRGLGFKTFRNLPTEHKRPLPTVTYDDVYLIFTFSRAYGVNAGDERLSELSETEAKGYDYIRLNSPVTRKDYEDSLGISQRTAARNLIRLMELGLIKKSGTGPKTIYEITK